MLYCFIFVKKTNGGYFMDEEKREIDIETVEDFEIETKREALAVAVGFHDALKAVTMTLERERDKYRDLAEFKAE